MGEKGGSLMNLMIVCAVGAILIAIFSPQMKSIADSVFDKLQDVMTTGAVMPSMKQMLSMMIH
ncbi:hypothetical protein [Turicibacter bilis]|uniref:hypothetical protein n=1 Tax=Turicibacter bilis TaxID=2735723 RepID=UPI001BAFF1C8|nr:hypothetical protein [Turicibacter bilis]MBS3199002.1 hypothetical protein [Turicibacter bilis]